MRTLALAVAIFLSSAAVADAATWRGKTRQGRLAKVVTGADGVVNAVRIKYRVVCSDGKSFRAGVRFAPPLDLATTTAVRDAGRINWRFEGGERARAWASVNAGLRNSGRWTGNFRLIARIFRDGRRIATCRTGRIGFKASPV